MQSLLINRTVLKGTVIMLKIVVQLLKALYQHIVAKNRNRDV